MIFLIFRFFMLKLNDNDSNDTFRNNNDRKKTISMIPIALKPITAITIIENQRHDG